MFRPVRAAMKGYQLPTDHSSANPPAAHRVIRGGANALVLGLLGPLARGEQAPGGYRLFDVKIGSDRIDYVFERAGATVRLRLGRLDEVEGTAVGASTSFRMAV